jgi:hypothetical protein
MRRLGAPRLSLVFAAARRRLSPGLKSQAAQPILALLFISVSSAPAVQVESQWKTLSISTARLPSKSECYHLADARVRLGTAA